MEVKLLYIEYSFVVGLLVIINWKAHGKTLFLLIFKNYDRFFRPVLNILIVKVPSYIFAGERLDDDFICSRFFC